MVDKGCTLLHNLSQHHIVALLEVWGKNLGICSSEVGFDLPAVQILNQRPLILLNRKLLSNPAGQVAKVEPLCFITAVLSRDQPSMEVDATFGIRAILITLRVTVCGLCLESSSPDQLNNKASIPYQGPWSANHRERPIYLVKMGSNNEAEGFLWWRMGNEEKSPGRHAKTYKHKDI